MSSLQSQIHVLEDENRQLREELDEIQRGLEQNQSSVAPEEVAVEEAVLKTSSSQQDTGIQDLSMADLTQPEVVPTSAPEVTFPAIDLEKVVEENSELHQQLEEARTEAATLMQQIQEDNLLLSPEMKEKIRNVEKLLEKCDVSVEQPQEEDSDLEFDESDGTDQLLLGKLSIQMLVHVL